MQKVEMYYDMFNAKQDMDRHISGGWRIHTCTMTCYDVGYGIREKVLVIYEK